MSARPVLPFAVHPRRSRRPAQRLQTEIGRWADLPRDERRRVARKLREAYLRMGNMLEEWCETQVSEGTE